MSDFDRVMNGHQKNMQFIRKKAKSLQTNQWVDKFGSEYSTKDL